MPSGQKKTDWENKLRELELQKKLLDFSQRLRAFIEKQSKTVRYIAAAVLLVIFVLLGFGGWYWYDKNYQEKAWQLYYTNTAKLIHQHRTSQEIIGTLQEIPSRYPRSQAAAIVYYRLGRVYQMGNETKIAIFNYKNCLKIANKDKELVPLAQIGLGYCYEMSGKYDEALESYRSAMEAKMGGLFASLNYQNIARVYELKGDIPAALAHYKKALALLKEPSSIMLVRNKIASLSN